MQHIFHYFVF